MSDEDKFPKYKVKVNQFYKWMSNDIFLFFLFSRLKVKTNKLYTLEILHWYLPRVVNVEISQKVVDVLFGHFCAQLKLFENLCQCFFDLRFTDSAIMILVVNIEQRLNWYFNSIGMSDYFRSLEQNILTIDWCHMMKMIIFIMLLRNIVSFLSKSDRIYQSNLNKIWIVSKN